jgi:hypothetical protein
MMLKIMLVYPSFSRRWLDQEPVCQELLDMLQQMACPGVQDFGSQLLLGMVDRIASEIHKKTENDIKTLGIHALKQRYLTKSAHMRWYDRHPVLKKAIGNLYALPLQGLTVLGFKLREPMNALGLYSFSCIELAMEPDPSDMMDIAKFCLYEPQEDSDQILETILGKDLFESLNQAYLAQHQR